jgi:energy-converting hydrogenase B subunit D
VTVLQILLFGLAALAGALAVMTRNPRHQALALGLYGLVLALLFAALEAPEVAIAQAVVGSVALPLMVLAALASVSARKS